MPSWMIKELSLLAKVSIPTLHHYDEIGLLKPSLRKDNGYRVYSERDLAKLQQIIALKYLGFALKQIRLLLEKKVDLFEQLEQQRTIIKQKEESFFDLSKSLDSVLCNSKDKKISLHELINLIERFNMKQNYDNAWMEEIILKSGGQAMSSEEKKSLEKISKSEWIRYNEKWGKLIEEVEYMVSHKIDPLGSTGQLYVTRWMDHALKFYSKETWSAIWSAIKNDSIPQEYQLEAGWPKFSKEIIDWIETAISYKNNQP